jgi:hypothetical protein
MIVQCPDCQTKMQPKPPAGTREGARVSVTCRCGTVLRFRMPGTPRAASATPAPLSDLAGLGDLFGSMFGGGKR